MKAFIGTAGSKRNPGSPPSGAKPNEEGFTLTDLLVVLAVVTFGLLMLAPAMGNTQTSSRALQCLNNLRQLQVGALAYSDDSAGMLLPNAPAAVGGWISGNAAENWGNSLGNIDVTFLNGALAPYVAYRYELYKCPGDTVPSDNGQRVRSYSMNGMMGTIYDYNSRQYKLYQKVTDLVGGVTPSKALVLMEESMWTLNDGYLQVSMTAPNYPDLPGSYHNGAMGASFADGHTELHQWVTPYVIKPVQRHVTSFYHPSSGRDVDYMWLKAHCSELR